MKRCKMAILGVGHIANSMAEAMNGISDSVECYAAASRDLDRAEAFAQKWGFQKAYGSYEELVNDPEVELVYVATPHSHHYEHAKLCLEHGKPALVEKAFTANTKQAKELIELSKQRHILVQEAMWTRFIPAKDIVSKLLEEGRIGRPLSMEAEFSVPLAQKQRMYDPALAGGALLDLGIYALTFASMYFGDDILKIESICEKYETGVDATDDVYYTYTDGRTAHLRTSFVTGPINEGTIVGTEGSLKVTDLNNYSSIRILDKDGQLVEDVPIPKQVNGYEYEVLECIKALREGRVECLKMPHILTLEMMQRMDDLRHEWGVVYPFE